MDAGASPPVVLDYPFRGRWLVRNSPARRIPSHGTHLFGVTYAIDFIGVDVHGRPAPITWRTAVATEAPELFAGFGRPILAPAGGTVVATHDGEPDHEARRSQLALLPYMLGQRERARRGAVGLAGNHVTIALTPQGPFVLLAHLRRGSVRVHPATPSTPASRSARAGTRATAPNRTSTSRRSTASTSTRPPAACPSPSGTRVTRTPASQPSQRSSPSSTHVGGAGRARATEGRAREIG